jgi:hypothetical protein
LHGLDTGAADAFSRYRQQQIFQTTIECLLGAVAAVRARLDSQLAATKDLALRETARAIADRVGTLFTKNGWAVNWSGHGTVRDVISRWQERGIVETLKIEAEVDFAKTREMLSARAEALRDAVASGPVDVANASAPSKASQQVIELKTRRHQPSDQLRPERLQIDETKGLLESLKHRIGAADDLYRLKTEGVGRLDHMECPTCHRDIDPETFDLHDQAKESIAAHIEALKRDRIMVSKNLDALVEHRIATEAELNRVDVEFREAERSLMTVTQAVGTVREQ